ncbi:putative protein phosphatase 2C 1, partial [Bienertia sinuspersici]
MVGSNSSSYVLRSTMSSFLLPTKLSLAKRSKQEAKMLSSQAAVVNCDPQVLLRKAHTATSSIGQVMFSTCPQEHNFDCPYQLSSESSGQTYLDAVVSNVRLNEGDIVVVGSDGLFDNVFDQEIVSTVVSNNDVAEAGSSIFFMLAKALASLAREHSVDFYFDSPYSSEARTK